MYFRNFVNQNPKTPQLENTRIIYSKSNAYNETEIEPGNRMLNAKQITSNHTVNMSFTICEYICHSGHKIERISLFVNVSKLLTYCRVS